MRSSKSALGTAFAVALVVTILACGKQEKALDAAQPATTPVAGVTVSDLTSFQTENGIGPITEEITLGPINEEQAEHGKAVFETKCSACHKMKERYVGPALGEVTVRRKPAFIMNQILNPQEMYTRHPVVKQLLAEFLTQMPNQGLTQEEALAVLEYLRTQEPGAASQD